MVRDNLEPDAALAFFSLAPSTQGAGSLRGSFRRESNLNRSVAQIAISQRDVPALPIYLKIKRVGARIGFERSADGVAYTEVGSKDLGTGANTLLTLGENFFIGLVATASGVGSSRVIFSSVSGPSFKEIVPPKNNFRRGDVDASATIDISDAVGILSYLFQGTGTPECLEAADTDDNGEVDITDAVNNLGYQFLGQPPPSDPGPTNCGADSNAPFLGCNQPCP